MNVLVSACLLGIFCRYNGDRILNEDIGKLAGKEEIHLIPVCPEQLGGLKTPRNPSEQKDGKVYDKTGEEQTEAFTFGAKEVLRLAGLFHCPAAILKERSPSCGSRIIYDGSFSGRKIPGDGVCAGLLKANGIRVFGETELSDFFAFLNSWTQDSER